MESQLNASHWNLEFAHSTNLLAGFPRSATGRGAGLSHWVITERHNRTPVGVGHVIIVADISNPESQRVKARITHIRALEIDWVSFYAEARTHVLEITVPLFWAELPQHRRLEYVLLSTFMPRVLASVYPVADIYANERTRDMQALKRNGRSSTFRIPFNPLPPPPVVYKMD